MNTPVSFKVDFSTAKLLKEKEYPFHFITVGELKEIPLNIPTIAKVIMWFYEKHGIWIEIRKHTRNGLKCFSPYIDNKPVKEDVFFNDYDSPIKAYKAAIEYTLKKLI